MGLPNSGTKPLYLRKNDVAGFNNSCHVSGTEECKFSIKNTLSRKRKIHSDKHTGFARKTNLGSGTDKK